ncbi:B12-binding domain-containing radical SAM protein [Candidatus Pacearchaeota archaeon]|nr:B12-binding domain-containing radical SAM protein [Candidatus Pacearchaeota archaeon]
MKISLVCPTNYYGASATRGLYYPMGVLLVGSLVKDTFPDWEVNVVDGESYNESELESKLKEAEVLGLSANTNNYQHCVNLANFAKSNGTKLVVVGGPHASAVLRHEKANISMAELILKNQQSIDAVIVYDGEHSFLQFLIESRKSAPDYTKINNLFWRDTDQIIKHNQIILPTQSPRFVDMDFSLMDFEKYWQEHKKEFPAMSERYIEGFTHVGCAWREKLGCSFCDIPYPFNNYQAPGRFWRDVREAKHSIGIQSFKDYGDCLTGNPERVRALLDARPSDMYNLEFSCYGRSKEITEEMAQTLADLNVRYVYIGYDSGDNDMLRAMQEGYTLKANYDATERLAKRGINITGSIILGAAGESEQTIANTEKFARAIAQYPNVTQLYCAMLTPFPGAPMNRKFLQANPQFTEQDVWDTEQTKRFWVAHYCKAPYEYIEEKAREINNLNPSSRKRYFGLKRE